MPAKFSLLTVIAVPLLPILPLLACGGDDGNTIHVPDAGKTPDAPPPVVCSAMASYGTVSTFSAQGIKYTAGSAADATNELLWQGKLADSNALEVLIFGGCGSGSGSQCGGNPTPDWPTTFGPKASIDIAQAPDALVLLLAKLNTSTNRFDDIYLGTAGTLNVTAAGTTGSTFSGSVSNLTAEHVIISQTSIDPAPDGCQSMVTGFAWSGSAMFTGKTTIIEGPTREEALRSYLTHRFQ